MPALRGDILFSLLCFLLSTVALPAQTVDQLYFEKYGSLEVEVDPRGFDMDLIGPDISIDHGCTQHGLRLDVTEDGYATLMATGHPFVPMIKEDVKVRTLSMKEIDKLRNPGECLPVFDFYPDYDAYVQMMEDFVVQYPDLCELMDLGTLDSGRKILMLHIGDNISESEDEPQVLYTSSMHGDELGGFPVLIQFIDHLLCQYDSDDQIRRLVDEIDLYVSPLTNPDGMYRDDNATIENPRRRNANNVDLNRNYPDPEDGDQPDNRPRQDETIILMDFADAHDIDLACNIHSGAEVVNYPWDTFEHLPADVDWWIKSCRTYADTAQTYSADGYMTDLDNGITNGFEWFEVRGGRQDYMNFDQRAREFTLEISQVKVFDAAGLPDLWEANRRSLINYMGEALNGLRGIVRDCETDEPLMAEIRIEGHDEDNSSVFSHSALGNYHRYLHEGNYTVSVIADTYETQDIVVDIACGEVTLLNVDLCPAEPSSTEEIEDEIRITQSSSALTASSQQNIKSLALYDYSGKMIKTIAGTTMTIDDITPGAFLLSVQLARNQKTYPIFIK